MKGFRLDMSWLDRLDKTLSQGWCQYLFQLQFACLDRFSVLVLMVPCYFTSKASFLVAILSDSDYYFNNVSLQYVACMTNKIFSAEGWLRIRVVHSCGFIQATALTLRLHLSEVDIVSLGGYSIICEKRRIPYGTVFSSIGMRPRLWWTDVRAPFKLRDRSPKSVSAIRQPAVISLFITRLT